MAEEQAALATLTAPPTYDWRKTDGTSAGNYVTPVKNQGNCGSCWAFAATAALESQVLLSNQALGGHSRLSEQLLVSCGNAGNCAAVISAAWPIISGTWACRRSPATLTPPPTAPARAPAPTGPTTSYKIPGWHYVATGTPTVEVLRNALITYGPLVTTFSVYSDFDDHKPVYTATRPATLWGGTLF